MAYSFLQAINETLKKVKMIQGDSSALTTFTDSGRQLAIDTAIRVWNEEIHEMYSLTATPMPNEYAESTITLQTNVREYPLPNDFERMRWPMIDQTNGKYILEWPDGYLSMREIQLIPAKWVGLAIYATIDPSNKYLRLGWIPTSTENGLVYNFGYDKRIYLSAISDTFPFSDTVVDSLMPAVAEKWKFNMKGSDSFTPAIYNQSIGRAARLVSAREIRKSYQ